MVKHIPKIMVLAPILLLSFANTVIRAKGTEESLNIGLDYYAQKNFQEAHTWFLKAAEQGNPYAQYKLGNMYYFGEGIERNYSEALIWFSESAQQGNADAQYNLGTMYLYGDGTKVDRIKAAGWFRKAAVQGHSDAQHNLNIIQNESDSSVTLVPLAIMIAVLASTMAVGVHKGGSVFNWIFAVLFLSPWSWIAAYLRHPRGFWKYIFRYANESDFMAEQMRLSQKDIGKYINKMGDK